MDVLDLFVADFAIIIPNPAMMKIRKTRSGTWDCFISDKSSKMCCEKISNKISNKSNNKQQQLEEQWQASTRAAAKRAKTRISTRRYKSNSNSNKRSNKNKSITQVTSQTFSWCLVAKWWPGCFQILCQNFKLFRRARPAVKSRGLWMLRMSMRVQSTTGFVGPWQSHLNFYVLFPELVF